MGDGSLSILNKNALQLQAPLSTRIQPSRSCVSGQALQTDVETEFGATPCKRKGKKQDWAKTQAIPTGSPQNKNSLEESPVGRNIPMVSHWLVLPRKNVVLP